MNSKIEQPVLPWHYDAAREINSRLNTTHHVDLASLIARHDEGRTDSPALRLEKNKHATTLRLLDELDSWVESTDGYEGESSCLRHQIRAHLAAMKGSQ